MFAKLLKYELKSIGNWYLGLLFITSLVAIATGNFFKTFLSHIDGNSSYEVGYEVGRFAAQEVSFLMSTIILVGLTLTITIAAYVIIIRRFYSSIFSRQGYLTMTLPVSPHAIILSKLLVAALLFVVTYLIFAIIGAAFILPSIGLEGANELIKVVSAEIFPLFSPLWMILWILNMCLSTISAVLLIYLAIAIGQMFNGYRILMGFVSYGIIIMISTLISLLLSATFSDNTLVLAELIMTIILMIASYFATHAIIKYKLNLE